MRTTKKLCGIKLKIKFPVIAGSTKELPNGQPDPKGEFNGRYYPTGEEKTTEDGDEWGSKGQGGKDQEVELEVLGTDSTPRWLMDQRAHTPIEVDTGKTNLDPTPGAKSIVEAETEVWFICCVCYNSDPEDCCKIENFTSPGGGNHCHLGGTTAWNDPSNEKCRTPKYSVPFNAGPPEDPTREIRNSLEGAIGEDIIYDLSKSYANLHCEDDDKNKKNPIVDRSSDLLDY